MATGDRSFADILRDSMSNLQEIVRSEVRLARTEFVDEAVRAKSSLTVLFAGAVTGLFAALFLLLAIVFALALVIPIWAASLILGTTLALAGSMTLSAGINRLKQRPPTLERTAERLKENVAWVQRQSK